MIRLDGYAMINDDEYYFENFIIDVESEREMPFSFLVEDEYEHIEDELYGSLDFLVDTYTELFTGICGCEECIREILVDFIGDMVDILVE